MAARPRRSGTRELILQSAREHFGRYGFAKSTMDEIAGSAAMAKASLYYHFPTKESLFQAVMINEHKEFLKSVHARLATESPACEKIRAYVTERYDYFNTLLNLNILDLPAGTNLRPIFAETFEEFSRLELKILRRVIREGIARGEFRVASAERSAEALLHIMQGLRCRFLRQMRGGLPVESRHNETLGKEVHFVTEIFLRGIRSGNA